MMRHMHSFCLMVISMWCLSESFLLPPLFRVVSHRHINLKSTVSIIGSLPQERKSQRRGNDLENDVDLLTQFKSNDGEYNGTLVDLYFNARPFLALGRAIEIGVPLLRWYLDNTLFNKTAGFLSATEQQTKKNELAVSLRDSIVATKSVTFIKSGQALSLRQDIVKSPELIRELTKLQDEVGTFSNEISMNIIREELGAEPSDVYEFDPIYPIASASIGQVYRARLRSSGQIVAVKVQRPDAVTTAPLDMYLLRKLAMFLKMRYKVRSNLIGIADTFGSQLFKELDYVQEANNCLKFRELYGGIPNIYVPLAYLDYTTRRVLTMEFIEGVKGPWTNGGERMLTIGLQCSVLQMLGTGYFHCDPHRGNLLQVQRPDGQASLAYLDFGMMSVVPADQRYALIGTVIGLVNQDIPLVIKNLKKLDFFPPETDETVVVQALTQAVFNATDRGAGSSLNFTKLQQNIDSISTVLPFRLPPFYTFIIRTLSILEGLAVNIDPNFRLIRGAYPFIAKQILESPNKEMTELLKSVLLDDEKKIKWDKLEELVSIASNANSALMSNDFNALKRAQEQSDLIKRFNKNAADRNSGKTSASALAIPDRERAQSGSDVSTDVSFDMIVLVMDYLLSEQGSFLLAPLITDIADTIDALGLTALTVTSLATNGLIPKPGERPDRERVELFFRLLSSIFVSNDKGHESIRDEREDLALKGTGRLSNNKQTTTMYRQRAGVLNDLFSFASTALSLPIQQLQPDRLAKIQSLASKSQVLIRGVGTQLAERSAVRIVRDVINPTLVTSLPLVSRVLDFVMTPQRKSALTTRATKPLTDTPPRVRGKKND